MAHDFIFVHHCNYIAVLLISGFASAAIHLSFDRGPDMLTDVLSSKRIKFIRAEYIDFDRKVITSQPSIDVKNIGW